MSPQRIHSSPFKGLVPYTEADSQFFFGRETIRDIIIASLQTWRLTLLYGASGVGKSSVLHAGVLPQLRQMAREGMVESSREKPEFSVVTFNSWSDDPVIGLARTIHAHLGEFLKVPHQSPSEPTLTEAIKQWTDATDAELYIILDQFEEYFQYHAVAQGPATLTSELPRAVAQSRQRIKFLISIRDDAVAKLDLFKGRLPNLFDHIQRVRPLSLDEARKAIEGPIERYNAESNASVSIEPQFLDEVLHSVKRVEVTTDRAGMEPGQAHVDAAILQQVMTRLWEEDIEQSGGRVLRLNTFRRLGGAQKIVSNHFSSAMAKLSPIDQKTAAAIFRYLVTPSGTKIAQTTADLAAYSELSDSSVSSVLEKLSGRDIRILRAISPPPNQEGEVRYEIFHDVLSGPINDWWRSYEAEARAKRDAARERAQVRVKYARIAFGGLAVVLVAVFLLMLYAFRQRALASEWAQKESSARGREQDERVRALEWAARELAAKQDAENQAIRAQQAQEEAEHAKDEAITARDLANQRTTAMIAARTTDKLYREAFRQSRREEQRETAIENFKKALKVYTDNPGELNRQAATDTYLNIGEVYVDIGNEASASKSFQHALKRCKTKPEKAAVLRNIADVYKDVYPYSLGSDVDPRRIATDRYNEALAIYQTEDDASNQAAVLVNLAVLKYQGADGFRNTQMPDREEAFKLIDAALELYKLKNDHRGQGHALLTLAQMKAPQPYVPSDVLPTVIDKLEEALKHFERAQDVSQQVEVHNRLVQHLELAGQFDKALANLDAIAKIYTQRNDETSLASTFADIALFNLRHTPETSAEYVRYIREYGKAADLYEKSGRPDKAAFAWRKIGTEYYPKAKRPLEATSSLENAVRLFHLDGDHQREILTLYDLSTSFSKTDKTKTLSYLEDISSVVEKLETRQRAKGLYYLGSGYLAVNELVKASKHFELALAIYKDSQDIANERATLESISREYLARSMVGDSINFLDRLLKLYKDNPLGQAQTQMSFGAAYSKQGKTQEALQSYQEAERLFKEQKYPSGHIRASQEIGKLHFSASRFDAAIATFEGVRRFVETSPYYQIDGEMLTLLAQSYAAKKENSKAIAIYEEAAKTHNSRRQGKEESKALLAISDLYKSDGDEKKAEEYKLRAEQASKASVNFGPPPPGP